MSDFIVGLALVLVIEGALYAAFPDFIRKAMADMFALPSSTLRKGGLAALFIGVFVVWLIRG